MNNTEGNNTINNLNQEDNTFTIVGENGEVKKCEVIFTYCNEDTNKNYIAYTDNTLDEDGNTKVYASVFDPEVEDQILYPIETDNEWALIEKILYELTEGNCDDSIDCSVTQKVLDLLNEE